MKVSEILRAKGSMLYSVAGQSSVFEAIKIMAEKNIGALLVLEAGELKGIFSERDYARKVILKGKNSHETTVSDIMTNDVFTILPDDSIEKCMETMTQKHIRHLPVVKEGQVLGVISIGDVVNAVIQSQKETIDHLQNYISQ